MSRLLLWVVLALGLAACSTRAVVVDPEQVPKLDDPQWTISSEPGVRPR